MGTKGAEVLAGVKAKGEEVAAKGSDLLSGLKSKVTGDHGEPTK